MNALCPSREDWAGFRRNITNRDYIAEGLRDELVEVLRAVLADVDVPFAHGLNCQQVDAGRFRASAEHVELIVGQRAQQPFGHLAAC